MSDDYEPALDMTATEAGAESEAVVRRDDATAAAPTGTEPVQVPPSESYEEGGPRGQRQWNPKSRAMFRELAAKVRAGEVSVEAEELVPMEHAAPAAPATPEPSAAPAAKPLVPATASPAAQAAAAVPAAPVAAPAAPPPNLPATPRAADQQRELMLELREKQLAEREARLASLEKTVPTRDKLVEAPIPTLAEYIKSAYGITDDAELQDTITDLMTEMSEKYHGVKLPDDVKLRVESRTALRKVKAWKSGLERQQAELTEKQAAAAKAAEEEREKAAAREYEERAVAQLTSLIGERASAFPYLAVEPNYATIVWDVLKEQHNRGQATNWSEAAKVANDFYKAQHEKSQAESAQRAARLQSLLAPAAPVAPAKPAASPGVTPGPVTRPPAQPTVLTEAPKPAPVDPADDLVGEDRRERRARSLRDLAKKHGLGANQGR